MQLYEKTQLKQISQNILQGHIIAFPTDTVYGLGCLYGNTKAEQNIYKAKKRPGNKPLPVMCCNLDMIKTIAITDKNAQTIISRLTPGALTLILNKKDETGTIAIRIPDDPWILNLINTVGKPLSVTSANLSDQGSLQDWQDVLKDLKNNIDGLVKGKAQSLTSSTIVDLTSPEIKILRQGPISLQTIKETLQ